MTEFKDEPLLNLKFNETHEAMREYAKEFNVPIIQDEGLAFLESIIRIKKPKTILEIGTAIGYSATRMALACDAQIYTIERNIDMYNKALENIKTLNLEDRIKVIFKDASEAFSDLADLHFDLIFIDAAKGQYTNFFNLYTPLLNDGGVVVCDNMLFHGLVESDEEIKSRSLRGLIRKLKAYHEYLLNNEAYDTSIFEIGDGISVSVKK